MFQISARWLMILFVCGCLFAQQQRTESQPQPAPPPVAQSPSSKGDKQSEQDPHQPQQDPFQHQLAPIYPNFWGLDTKVHPRDLKELEIIDLLECYTKECKKFAGKVAIREKLTKLAKKESSVYYLINLQETMDQLEAKNTPESRMQFQTLTQLRSTIIVKGDPSTFFFTEQAISLMKNPVEESWDKFDSLLKELGGNKPNLNPFGPNSANDK